ncbi:MAG: 2-C-methyl-D-erythritol 2,4-cyclodiphosphate synthase [Acidobacteria bacterium]|jgi:2-C-methyl-D-erythritol 2,4-cyclodiphosphate synthase|nr:2-C-methyl-D-erythritol 2,4-cyclodiphosphate synthase [Acidobacteriota bacterium]
MRVGHGWDIHRLASGRQFKLGGVLIDWDKGPLGHSDGDALLHALCDALLGACALGDIGLHFSDSDPKWKDCDSGRFVTAAVEMASGRGFRPVNADVTIILEAPKLAPYREAITENIASLLGLPKERVNVKAKTAEGFGPEGAGDAVSCHAVVLMEEQGR